MSFKHLESPADPGCLVYRNPKAGYGWRNGEPMNSVDYCVRAIERHLRRLGCKRVIDIGCGNGAMTGMLAKAGFEMTGIEPDQNGFRLATESYPNIRFHNFGVYDDASHLGQFDAVISSEVIEHLFDPTALLRLAHQLLPPHGILILTCPYYGYVKNLLLSLTDRWDDHHQPARVGGHIKLWSHRTMSDFLCNNGFESETMSGAGRCWLIWASLLAVAVKQR